MNKLKIKSATKLLGVIVLVVMMGACSNEHGISVRIRAAMQHQLKILSQSHICRLKKLK